MIGQLHDAGGCRDPAAPRDASDLAPGHAVYHIVGKLHHGLNMGTQPNIKSEDAHRLAFIGDEFAQTDVKPALKG